MPRAVNGRSQVGSRVHRLEDSEKVFEVGDEGVPEMRNEIRAAGNRAFIALEAVAGDAPGFEEAVEFGEVAAALEEPEIGLADDHVIGGGIVVELLVPFFEEMAAHFLDVMAMHDPQDFVPHFLTVAAAAEGGHDEAQPFAFLRVIPVAVGQFERQPFEGVAQFPRFGVVVALPVELPQGRIPQPHIEQRQACGVPRHPVQQIVAEVETVHERPGVAAHLPVDDLVGQLGEAGMAQVRRAAAELREGDKEIAAPLLQPAPGIGLLQHKNDPERRLGLVHGELQALPAVVRKEGGPGRRLLQQNGPGRQQGRWRRMPIVARAPRYPPVQDQRRVARGRQDHLIAAADAGYGDLEATPGGKIVGILIAERRFRRFLAGARQRPAAGLCEGRLPGLAAERFGEPCRLRNGDPVVAAPVIVPELVTGEKQDEFEGGKFHRLT